MTMGVDADGRIVVSVLSRAGQDAEPPAPAGGLGLVLSDDWNGEWVQVDGTGEVLDLPDAMEPMVGYYRAISGEHPDWEEYRAAMQRQGKVLLRITVERWGPISRRRVGSRRTWSSYRRTEPAPIGDPVWVGSLAGGARRRGADGAPRGRCNRMAGKPTGGVAVGV